MGISTVGRFSTVGWCVIIRLSAVDTVHQNTHTHTHTDSIADAAFLTRLSLTWVTMVYKLWKLVIIILTVLAKESD